MGFTASRSNGIFIVAANRWRFHRTGARSSIWRPIEKYASGTRPRAKWCDSSTALPFAMGTTIAYGAWPFHRMGVSSDSEARRAPLSFTKWARAYTPARFDLHPNRPLLFCQLL